MPEDVGADARPRRGHLPVLGGLAAGPAGRPRPGQPGRAGLLRPAGGRTAGPGHRPVGHPLPLGPAAGAGGRGRLAGTRHRLPVRRLRDARLRPAQRPGTHLDHAERAVVLGDARLRVRPARPGPAGLRGRHARRAPSAARARPGHPADARRRARTDRSRHHAEHGHLQRGHRQRGRPERRPPRGRPRRADLPRPAGARPLPAGHRRRPRRARDRAAGAGRRPGDHLGPDRRARASTTTSAPSTPAWTSRGAPRTRTGCRWTARCRSVGRGPRWTGRSCRRASPSCWSGSAATTPACRWSITENGAAFDDQPDANGFVQRRRPDRLLRLAHRRGRRAPASRAPTSAATSPGR